MASERTPDPSCSFTTETIGAPKLLITTENCLSGGRSASFTRVAANEAPGKRVGTERRQTQAPSLKRLNSISRSVGTEPLFWTMKGVVNPVGPPSAFVTLGR